MFADLFPKSEVANRLKKVWVNSLSAQGDGITFLSLAATD